MLGKEYTVGNFATTNIHSSEGDPEGHRETTKLIFTLRLILRQAIVGGSFHRPTSHLRPFSLLCYLSLVAWGISSLLFSHLPLFFSFSFISPHRISPYSCCCCPPQEWTLIPFPGITGVLRWVSPHPPFLSAFLNGVEGLCQARPSKERAVSLVSYSKRSSVLPFGTLSRLIYWGLFWKRNSWDGGGEGKFWGQKNCHLVSKGLWIMEGYGRFANEDLNVLLLQMILHFAAFKNIKRPF